jgi:hypothetical protein
LSWPGGYSDFASSVDGVTWTKIVVDNNPFKTNSGGWPVYGIAYGGKRFIAGGGVGRIAYSNLQE